MMHHTIFRKKTHSEIYTSPTKFERDTPQMRKTSSTYENRSACGSIRTGPRYREESTGKTESLKNFTYNKWYIKPKDRLKVSVPSLKVDKTREQFYYKELFKPHYQDQQCPFSLIANDKIKLFEKIPKNNVSYIDTFRKNQIAKKKRVPQIIEMLMKQQQQQKQKSNPSLS